MTILTWSNVHIHSHHDTSSIGYLTAKTTSLWWITSTIQTHYSNTPISGEEVRITAITLQNLCVTPNLSSIREVPVSLSYTIWCIYTSATIASVSVAM